MSASETDALRSCGLPVVFVLGGPGSGKGTQCEMIVEKYGYTHLSTGDLLRAEVSSGSELGVQLSSVMEQGGLVPLENVLQLLREAMLRAVGGSRGFLIDGFPRELAQVHAFEERVSACSRVIYLELSDAVMTERLLLRGQSSGRADDNADTIRQRLVTFHEISQPVVDHYGDRCVTINAERSKQDVFTDVCAVLNTL